MAYKTLKENDTLSLQEDIFKEFLYARMKANYQLDRYGLVSLFNGISILFRLFNA